MNFVDDKRAVSEVLGAMLIFAMLITGLGVYQAFWVPSANAEMEIQHELDVNDQMVEVRGGVVEAAIGGTETSASVKLGAAYESRTFAVNPPDPVGTLRTGAEGDIALDGGSTDLSDFLGYEDENGNEQVANVTRSLTFTPEYNEHDDSGPIVFEHTAVYQEFAGDRFAEREQHRLLEEGTVDNDDEGLTLTVVPVYGEVDERGVSIESLEFRPGFKSIERDADIDNITLPVENQDYWESVGDEFDGVEIEVDTEGIMTIDLRDYPNDERIDIIGAPVGINEDPPQGPREDEEPPGDGDSGGSGAINPVDRLLLNETDVGNDITLTFDLVGTDEVVIDRARLNVAMATSGETSDECVDSIYHEDHDNGNADLLGDNNATCMHDPWVDLTDDIVIGDDGGDEEYEITFTNPNNQQGLVVISFLVDGQSMQYMIRTKD